MGGQRRLVRVTVAGEDCVGRWPLRPPQGLAGCPRAAAPTLCGPGDLVPGTQRRVWGPRMPLRPSPAAVCARSDWAQKCVPHVVVICDLDAGPRDPRVSVPGSVSVQWGLEGNLLEQSVTSRRRPPVLGSGSLGPAAPNPQRWGPTSSEAVGNRGWCRETHVSPSRFRIAGAAESAAGRVLSARLEGV